MPDSLRRRRVIRLTVLCVAALAAAGLHAVSARAAVALPSQDPFYTYSGATALAKLAPGTILKTRTIAITETDGSGAPAIATPLSATQVLYRSTGEQGQAIADVATIIRPLLPLQGSKIISYQEAYDGLGGQCDPSYAFQGGTPTTDTNPIEQQLILTFAAEGYTVVSSDYEGTANQWLAGQQSGYATLDAIRATETMLKLTPALTPVGMLGYSGGSVPTDFAAELAPSYAPGLDIVGAAFGGAPVDLAHNLDYVNGTATYASLIPAVFTSFTRDFSINLSPYLSAYGVQLTNDVAGKCINQYDGDWPHLYVQSLLKPQYANPFTIRPLVQALNRTVMGNSGTPRVPLYIGVGNSDGTGDTLMVAADSEGLAHRYCQRGVSVQFAEYKGDDHTVAFVPFLAAAEVFLIHRMNGMSVPDQCATIGVGNSLAPLPVPAAPATARPVKKKPVKKKVMKPVKQRKVVRRENLG